MTFNGKETRGQARTAAPFSLLVSPDGSSGAEGRPSVDRCAPGVEKQHKSRAAQRRVFAEAGGKSATPAPGERGRPDPTGQPALGKPPWRSDTLPTHGRHP